MKKWLMVGAGGFARSMWIDRVLSTFADRVQVVGLVDVNEEALADSGRVPGLDDECLFTDVEEAVEQVEADFCSIVIPPSYRKQAAVAAAEKGMAIISEKPIADTMEASVDIYRAVKSAGVPMTVMQNYRYNPQMWTFRRLLRGGELGRINYLVARFAANYNEYGSWGSARYHDTPYAFLIEGSVHHLDMLRNLTGADAVTVEGLSWNPQWSSFSSDCCGLFLFEMSDGSRAFYEGAGTNIGKLNGWHQEYYRAECERATVEVDADQVVRILRGDEEPEPVVLASPDYVGHNQVMHDFLVSLDTGEPTETCLDDNIKTMAMVFGAIEAAESGSRVQVASLLP